MQLDFGPIWREICGGNKNGRCIDFLPVSPGTVNYMYLLVISKMYQALFEIPYPTASQNTTSNG
jgi:hypothetical protein